MGIAMILSRSVWLGTVLLGCAVLAGCTTSPLSRIDSNRALYESWPLDIQEAVLEGKVLKDMTPDQVEMSVGKPREKTVRNARKGMEEVWIYRQGGGGPNLGGLTVGGAVGGVGVVQQGSGGGDTAEEFEVVFVDGRVVRSTLPQ
jgi:hypothetical protein